MRLVPNETKVIERTKDSEGEILESEGVFIGFCSNVGYAMVIFNALDRSVKGKDGEGFVAIVCLSNMFIPKNQ